MTDVLTSLLRHPLLSDDAKEACAAIDAIKARKIVELIGYLGLSNESREVLSNLDTSELIDNSVMEAKASLLKEESRLEESIEHDPEIRELHRLVVSCRRSCNTILNQLRGRVITRHIDKRCTAVDFEPPHEWLDRIGAACLLRVASFKKCLGDTKNLGAKIITKTRNRIVAVISVFRADHVTHARLEKAIAAATRLMRLADRHGLDYCFLQLELCRMMCQLLVVSATKLGDVTHISNKTRDFIWNPSNIPCLYPQLRFHDNHAATRVYSLFGFLFDNPRDCDPQPAEDRVAQLFKKAVPHKHQPHHFWPVTATWAREDGYNPARKLLIEIMTFFWSGAYPHCSRASRLIRDDELLYLYSTRANTRYVDMDRIVAELQNVSGLHAVKEYLSYLLNQADPSQAIMNKLSGMWRDYESGIYDTCEQLRRARLCPKKKKRFEMEQRAFDDMRLKRSEMTGVGASARIPEGFLRWVNRHEKIDEWDDNVLAVGSKTPEIDAAVRAILDAPGISFCKQVAGFVFYDKDIDTLAQSPAFGVEMTPDVIDFRQRDRACMMRLLIVLCVWFRVNYKDFCRIRSIVDMYYSGSRGASSYPVQFSRHFKDHPRLKSIVAAMAFTWVNLVAVTYTRLPANLNAHVNEAMVSRSTSLAGDDTLARLDSFWLCPYCGVCNCSHGLTNAYPKIGGAKIEGYHGHTDAGIGRGARVDLMSGQVGCNRSGSRIAFQCASAYCLAVSMKNCVVNWSRTRGFVCSCCGILATWCPVFGTSWSKGYLCARCSVIAPDWLDEIASGHRIARGGPAGSLRLKEPNRRLKKSEILIIK